MESLYRIEEAKKVKLERLMELLRGVLAEPSTLNNVANEIAKDWFPMLSVDADGKMTVAECGE